MYKRRQKRGCSRRKKTCTQIPGKQMEPQCRRKEGRRPEGETKKGAPAGHSLASQARTFPRTYHPTPPFLKVRRLAYRFVPLPLQTDRDDAHLRWRSRLWLGRTLRSRSGWDDWGGGPFFGALQLPSNCRPGTHSSLSFSLVREVFPATVGTQLGTQPKEAGSWVAHYLPTCV